MIHSTSLLCLLLVKSVVTCGFFFTLFPSPVPLFLNVLTFTWKFALSLQRFIIIGEFKGCYFAVVVSTFGGSSKCGFLCSWVSGGGMSEPVRSVYTTRNRNTAKEAVPSLAFVEGGRNREREASKAINHHSGKQSPKLFFADNHLAI